MARAISEAVPPTPQAATLPYRRWWRSGWFGDVAAVLAYLGLAMIVFGHLWRDPATRVLSGNIADQLLFEWMLRHAANALTEPSNPFLAPELGAPEGANLMGNTSMVLPGLLLTPVTLLAGPAVSFTVLLTLALAGTAASWYFLISRRITANRAAAFAGAAFCGFAPGMVSQATGHPQMAAQFLIPAMIALLVRLGLPGRSVRDGILLGLLVAAQILIGEETLLIAALALAVFLAIYAAQFWSQVRQRLAGGLRTVAIAAVTTLSLAGYPLWLQFFSPSAYHGLPNEKFAADLGSVTAYAASSLVGDPAVAARYSPNAGEQVIFFGLPLVGLGVASAAWLWRTPWIRSAALTGALFIVLSFGARLQLAEQPLHLPGAWTLLDGLPLLEHVIPVRLGLVAVPVLGLLIAASWDRAMVEPGPLGWLWPVALAVAMLPAMPTPLPGVGRTPLPQFIEASLWRECAGPGRAIVIFPSIGSADDAADYEWRAKTEQMRWQTGAALAFAVPDGYYIARDEDGEGRWGRPPRLFRSLVDEVAVTGVVPPIGARDRAQAHADLAYWRADCVAVLAGQRHGEAVRHCVTELMGRPPVRLADVWAWKVG